MPISGCTRDAWSNYTFFNTSEYGASMLDYCPGHNGTALLTRRDMENARWYLDVVYIIVTMIIARFIGLTALMLRMRWSKG
jgi:hypothetical protein